MKEEILVHHEERFDAELRLHARHHGEQLVAGIVEVKVLALASEERRRGAEVAAHRTADGRNDGCRGAAVSLRELESGGPGFESRDDFGMLNRRCGVLAEKGPHP